MRVSGCCLCVGFFASVCAFAGCGETTQTVGSLKAASNLGASQGVLPAAGNRPTTAAHTDAGAASAATGSSGSAGQGSGVAVAGGAGVGVPTSGNLPILPPPPPPPGVACAGSSTPATPRQFDLYLMIDTNITIPLSGAWDNVRDGLVSYANDRCADGVGVGVRYFGVDCNASTYATPTTPTAPLPQNAAAIEQDIPKTPFMASPTLPALQGALTYSGMRAQSLPDSKQIVVLISDGFYDFICQGPSTVASVFSAGSSSAPVTPTYVLALDAPNLINVPGLSQLLSPVVRFDPLDTIAQSGGTGKARHIDLQADPSVFAQSLVDIQHDAQPCDYAVPDAVRADPTAMAVGLKDDAGAQTALAQVSDAAACAQASQDGYYLDDPADPSWAVLCPSTCAAVKAGCDQVVWVTGCPAP